MEPIQLNEHERISLAKNLKEHLDDYNTNPDCSMTVIADRVADNMTEIFRGREWSRQPGNFLVPDDPGDNPDGTINVDTDKNKPKPMVAPPKTSNVKKVKFDPKKDKED